MGVAGGFGVGRGPGALQAAGEQWPIIQAGALRHGATTLGNWAQGGGKLGQPVGTAGKGRRKGRAAEQREGAVLQTAGPSQPQPAASPAAPPRGPAARNLRQEPAAWARRCLMERLNGGQEGLRH